VQNYQFVITASRLAQPGLTGYLVDNYLGTQTPLNIDGTTTVNFNIANTSASYDANRFEILFTPSELIPVSFTSVEAYKQDNGNIIDWKVSNEVNVKQYEVEESSDGFTFATLTVTPPMTNNGGSASYEATDGHPFQGQNYYRIKSVDINGKAIYSQIVRVQPVISLKSDISIYPNPLQNGTINLQFVNQATGTYFVRVTDQLGQPIISKQIMHSEGTGTEIIQLQKSTAHGVYQVEITKPDNGKKMIKVIY
jgi:methionine-rich copper-binding protein CopC